jgi:hypothetical protein
MLEIVIKVNSLSKKLLQFGSRRFKNLSVLNIRFGAGAALRYGSSSIKMMRVIAAPALQHYF